ncbi:PAS domain S-box protein [uncultured Pseudodesulfovibrio sp.]|uniref:PAS domain-containing sensor histidine kinase n=1 Tax=uncultured Pseudodesulfovibrio sp. TaxID=2035858 RepID=UPI0029C7EB91|nr:PAS domain S-box protein [uncultured Pseudodesulfovibrio sp.]
MKKHSTPDIVPQTLKQAADLENNPHLFRQILDASGVAMSIRDGDLIPIFANQAFVDFYGYSVEEIRSGTFETVLPETSLTLFNETVIPTVQSGESWEGEYTIQTKRGRQHAVWGRFDPVFDIHGNLTHVVSIMRDASDTMRLRNALTQTERHLNFLAENTSDCLFRLRLTDGRYDYISSAVENIVGYTPQEFYSEPWFIQRLIPEKWEDIFTLWIEELKAGRSRYEYEAPLIHKNGSQRWVNQRISVVTDSDGFPLAAEGIFTDVTERRRTQEELAAARMSLNFMSQSTSDIFFRMKIPEGTYEYISPSVERFSGYSVKDYMETPLFAGQLLHPDWIDYSITIWEEMQAGHIRPEYEFQFIHKSGEVRWARQRVVLHKDEQGNPMAIEGIVTDVTAHKESQEALTRSEARFRTLFEDSPISLWEEDLTRLKAYFDDLKWRGITDFRQFFYDNPDALIQCATLVDVVDVNKATLDLLHAKNREDLLGNLDKVLTDSSIAAFTEEMILLASGGTEYCGEITHRTLDGEIIWVMAHFTVPEEYRETLSRVIVSLLDVTPRKRAEQALMESEERYRVLVENSQEGVVVAKNRRTVFVNQAMADITGYPLGQLEGMRPVEIVHEEDRDELASNMAQYLAGNEISDNTSFRVITRDGTVKWLTLTVKPIMWGGKQAHLEILNDITIHKSLEEELRSAHADMESKVHERTLELSEANIRLQVEVEERRKAQDRILSLTRELFRVQENERQRISRDLHDNVAQNLSSIVLKMETFFDGHEACAPNLKERSQKITEVAKLTVADVRDIAYGLRPPALDQLGLVRAVQNHVEDMARKLGNPIDFLAVGIENVILDFDTEINIYRMIQEATNNIVKHSGASSASVRMVKSHPDLLIRIEDNGCGFDMDRRMKEVTEEKRMGLHSMEERARLVGGTMEVQSLIETGTRVIFKIPIDTGRRRKQP